MGVLAWFAGITGGRVWAAEEWVIVADGRARARILLPANPHALEKEAADDLRWAVKQATGVSLEVVSAPSKQGQTGLIRIGSAASPPSRAAAYDGCEVRLTADGVDLLGPTPAGTANAVATVLMEDFGVRMYYPDALFTVVPKARSLSIRGRNASPAFKYRIWSGVTGRDQAAYVRRNRLTDLRVPVPQWGFGHNLANIISVKEHGQTHPEYFAMRDGKRRVHGSDVADTTQPCFSNPEVVRTTVEAARRYFDAHPDRDTFSLCVNDNPWYCECERCSAVDRPYRDLPVGRQYSESYFDYVSRVAEAVAESHADRFVGVYAYWNVEQPPRNRKRLPDNVIVALTLDVLQHHDAAYRDKDRSLIRAWVEYTRHLNCYIYYGLGWLTPRTSPLLVAEDLRMARQLGVQAAFVEVYPFWAWTGPMDYLAARLQWRVDEDASRILDEFHRDCFGEAAAEMRAYHDACERYWIKPRQGRWFEGLENLAPEEAMADVAVLREAARHLETARAAAADTLVRQRIEWIARGFELSLAVGRAFEARRANPADALEQLISAAEAVEDTHQRLAVNPAYAHTYYDRSGRFDRKCWSWFKEAIRSAAEARWKQVQTSQPADQARGQWEDFVRGSGLQSLNNRHQWNLSLESPGK